MIFIVHGNNPSKSREIILNNQNKLGIKSRIEKNLTDLQPQEVYELAAAQDLFGEKTFIVLDITQFRKLSIDDYVAALKKAPKDSIIVILAQKSLTKTNAFIKASTELNAKIMETAEIVEGDVFKFVNVLFSKNRAGTYAEYQKLMDSDADIFSTFGMILYGLRNLLGYYAQTEKYKNMKPFQTASIQKQAQLFSFERVKELYNILYGLEKKLKTGGIPQDMFLVTVIENILE